MSLLLFDSFESDAEATVVVSNLATAASIRDRIIALITGRTPTSLADDRFRAYRNERGADFRAWAEENAAGAFRRFQVREVSDDDPPFTSNMITERVRTTFEIVIAYPQTHRYGGDNALDRDDVLNEDWRAVNATVGVFGASNFSGSNDCVILPCVKSRESGDAVDFLVVEATYEYVRAIGI